MDRELPILFSDKSECCGCAACKATCPKAAIIMIEDYEGFIYPKIQKDICIRCYKCINICPFK